MYTYMYSYMYAYISIYIHIQPIAFGVTFLHSQISINVLVL